MLLSSSTTCNSMNHTRCNVVLKRQNRQGLLQSCSLHSNAGDMLFCREDFCKKLTSIFEDRQKLNVEAVSVMIPEASATFMQGHSYVC